MIIPQDILDEIREKTSISNLISKKVTWDKKKTKHSKGDFWAPCPFHSEKTASFHVDDVKGYYYCFGCHKKGDAITFKMDAENFSFIEAVKILADEAGVNLPDKHNTKVADKNKPLREIVNLAKNFFKSQLRSSSAMRARTYLSSRNIEDSEITHFELGFAPQGPETLVNILREKGYQDSEIIESGMALKSDNSSKLYDRFQNRLIFPINDFRGRLIAFGGRALKSEQNAKYLNSPETAIFNKGSNLYNFASARANYRKESCLIVVEGYMDVISLNKFGFKSCVAPLGTAITSRQLELLWKISPEPIIMMDGDAAGVRAANKLIDILLPLIQFDKTVRFCFLPQGNDPDDFVNERGSAPLTELLTQSISLSECIWKRETDGLIFDSPERISTLNNRLKILTAKILDQNLRREYFNYFQKIKKTFFSKNSGENRQDFDKATIRSSKFAASKRYSLTLYQPTEKTKNSAVAKKNLTIKDGVELLAQNLIQLECFLLAFLIYNESVGIEIFEKFISAKYNTKSLLKIKRDLITLDVEARNNSTIPEAYKLEELKNEIRKILNEFSAQTSEEKFQLEDIKEVENIIGRLLEKQKRNKLLFDEFNEATIEINGVPDESLTVRLKEAHEAFQKFSEALNEKELGLDEGFIKNSELLKKFIDDKIWKKP